MISTLKRFLVAFFGLIIPIVYIASSLAGEPVKLDDRMLIFNELNKQNLLHKDRQLVHLVHVGNLIIDNEYYPVIDVIEYVKGAQVPRGVAHILVLDSSLKLTKKIYYDGTSSPLYCKDNKLFLYGFLAIDGLVPEGNVLSFSCAGKKVIVSEMEPNDFPVQIPPQ
jgi:hypothetical protein